MGATAFAAEVDCLKCHAKLKAGKSVHAALDMGCASCHTGIDASKVPHKKTNNLPNGLSEDQPALCYGCHDKTMFEKKTVHAAIGMGCTACHDPHASKNPKLLKAEAPDLCFGCHDKKEFTRKTVHAPVAGGMCLTCHNPHASNEISLLLKKPAETCLQCHEGYDKKIHGIAGFGAKPHPVRPETKKWLKTDKGSKAVEAELMDPSRPGKPFYCAGCHEPHSSNVPNLLRFNAKSDMDLCGHCHKM